jgi:hypothetical protein
MTGLFARLAARAAGSTLVVRSNAVLPYWADRLPMTGRADAPIEVSEPDPAIATGRPGSPPRAEVALEADDGVPERPPIAKEPRPDPQPLLRPPAPPLPAVVVDDSSPLPARAEPEQRAQPRLHSAEPAGKAIPAERPEPAPPPATRGREVAVDFGRRDQVSDPAFVTRRERNEAPPQPRSAGQERRSIADPPRLRPDEPARSTPSPEGLPPPRAPTEARWQESAAATTTELPNEVHVHIGRIEVIAEREAPRRRHQAASRPPTRSLEGYLAARDKR